MTGTPLDLEVGIGYLTARQRQVLAHAANGLPNAQIGRQLTLSPPTINRHLAEIYKTLGARDRANAVALALLSGDLFREDIQTPQRAARKQR